MWRVAASYGQSMGVHGSFFKPNMTALLHRKEQAFIRPTTRSGLSVISGPRRRKKPPALFDTIKENLAALLVSIASAMGAGSGRGRGSWLWGGVAERDRGWHSKRNEVSGKGEGESESADSSLVRSVRGRWQRSCPSLREGGLEGVRDGRLGFRDVHIWIA